MPRLRTLLALSALLLAPSAGAGIVFTPHLAEYARLPPGPYAEFTFIHSRIEESYGREGQTLPLGAPFVPPGESIDVSLALLKFLWVGNLFRDTDIPLLKDRPQFCRVIGTLSQQQASGAVTDRSRLFGLTSGGSGFGDLFGLCGIYGEEHRLGPLKFNGLFATTVKAPVGRFDERALLNSGTHYWSVIPQLALHANLWGRLFIDGTVAYQFKGRNDRPAYGGLTPTRPADFRNAEINLAWKFSERWYVDLGYSYRESVGANRFEQVTVNFIDPVPPQQACDLLGLDGPFCNSANAFFLEPQDREYRDRGVRGRLLTAGAYYVYRASTVLSLRLAQPVGGRGGQIDVDFDVFAGEPDPMRPGRVRRGTQIATTSATLNTVQEATAVSASPYLELRMVYLFWAP